MSSVIIYSLSCRWKVSFGVHKNISGASQQDKVAVFFEVTEVAADLNNVESLLKSPEALRSQIDLRRGDLHPRLTQPF